MTSYGQNRRKLIGINVTGCGNGGAIPSGTWSPDKLVSGLISESRTNQSIYLFLMGLPHLRLSQMFIFSLEISSIFIATSL
jgi:hypothetical protein